MKNILVFTSLAVFLLISCKKKTKEPIPTVHPSVDSNYFRVKKDGVIFSSTHIDAGSESSNNSVVIQASQGAVLKNGYILSVSNKLLPGTYSFTEGYVVREEYDEDLFMWHFFQDTLEANIYDGTFTILLNDIVKRELKAEFSLRMYCAQSNSFSQLTEGAINVKY